MLEILSLEFMKISEIQVLLKIDYPRNILAERTFRFKTPAARYCEPSELEFNRSCNENRAKSIYVFSVLSLCLSLSKKKNKTATRQSVSASLSLFRSTQHETPQIKCLRVATLFPCLLLTSSQKRQRTVSSRNAASSAS